MIKTASFSTHRGSPSAYFHGDFHYSPFKAADEKIPLSMVRVNNKPQHLVFCWCFTHLLSKHCRLPVESRKQPCLARCRAVRFALKSGQIAGPRPIPVPPSEGSPSQAPSQGAELVQNRPSPVRIVDIRGITELKARFLLSCMASRRIRNRLRLGTPRQPTGATPAYGGNWE